MKILHCSSALTWRGGEQQLAYLVDGLNALGHSNAIHCPNKSVLKEVMVKKGETVFTYDKSSGFSMAAARTLAANAKNFDIVHIHDSHAHTSVYLAAKFFRLKTPIVLSRKVDFPIGKNFISRYKYNYPGIKKIICVSDAIAKIIKPTLSNPRKVTTIHDGVDLTKIKPGKTGNLRQLLNINDDIPLIGNIAAIAPHKDYFTFVDTADQVLKRQPEARFVIIGGDGGEQEVIRKYIFEKNLSNSITMLGYRTDVPDLIGDLDLFLFTSKTEGLGSSILDAWLAEVPVVATTAGGIPELIEHNKSGLLCPVKDSKSLSEAVLNLLNNDNLAIELVGQGKGKVQLFSKEAMAKKTLEIYQSITSF